MVMRGGIIDGHFGCSLIDSLIQKGLQAYSLVRIKYSPVKQKSTRI